MTSSYSGKSQTSLFESALRAIKQTEELINTYGGRLAGGTACLNTADELADSLLKICGNNRIDKFFTHPQAFGNFYRIDVILYIVSVVLFLLNQPLAAGIISGLMVAAAGAQFGWYVELYDRFYPEKECRNVSASLEPHAEVFDQLILSGHHDSAREMSFLKQNQKLYGLKILLPDCARMLAAISSLFWVYLLMIQSTEPAFVLPMKLLLVLGTIPVYSKFHLFGDDPTPGAGDNLIASAMVLELARRFSSGQPAGKSYLQHTRLIFISFDAEEAGIRGSRAWVKENKGLINSIPTTLLNIDSIYSVRDLQFLTTDLNNHIKLSGDLANQCVRLSSEAGYPAKITRMTFGGGATDATEFARAGVQATTMIAMPTSIVREGLVYHTMQDTIEAIEPDAVKACLAISELLAQKIDNAY